MTAHRGWGEIGRCGEPQNNNMEQMVSFSVESISYNGWTNLMGCCCQKCSSCSFLLLLATYSWSFHYSSFDTGLAISKAVNGETGGIGKEKAASSSSAAALPPLLTMISHCSHPDSRTILHTDSTANAAQLAISFGEQESQHKIQVTLLHLKKKTKPKTKLNHKTQQHCNLRKI